MRRVYLDSPKVLRMFRTTLLVMGIVFGIVMVGAIPTAHAGFVLRLDAASTGASPDVTVTDNGAGDLDPTVGLIVFSGAVGNMVVNVSVGTSKPVIGSSDVAEMDILGLHVSGGAETLTIELTDTDFFVTGQNSKDVTITNSIGGTTSGGTVTAEGFLDPGNAEFGTTFSTGVLGPFGPIAFSGTTSNVVGPIAGPFSLTERVVVTHPEAGVLTSFDKFLTAQAPEPASLLLLGSGLLGLGWFGRKRLSKQG